MRQRNAQQNIDRIHTKRIIREPHLRTIQEREQRRLVSHILRPVDEGRTVRVEVGRKVYEGVTELAWVGAVGRMGVADVKL